MHYLRMYPRYRRQGFTLIEAVVTMVVASIGFLGTAGLILRTMEQQGLQDRKNAAVSLARTKAGQIGQVPFSLVGTGASAADKLVYGAASQAVFALGPTNEHGELNTGSEDPPFIFTINSVVCRDDASGGADALASTNADECGNVSSSRPDSLACDVSETVEGEAMIRILVTFRDKYGTCRSSKFEQLVVDYE